MNISIHDLKFFEAYDLVQAIANDLPVGPDFREGWEVERVIDAVDKSASERRWISIDSL